MALPLILAIVLASSSFLSGFIALYIFYQQNKTFSNKNGTKNNVKKGRITAPISARLPSLISIEIVLLLWYLMCCTPLILFFTFYAINYYASSIMFIFSFIPLYCTHIIRIWLLKLKYNVTKLSMRNQLGVAEWKHLRNTIWTKIYYNHKWCHNIKVLLVICIIFDIIITAIYTILIVIDIHYRFYLNIIIFPLLTLCVIFAIFSIKSLQDPFHIFREEAMILAIWFLAVVIYFIVTLLLSHESIDEYLWCIIVTFLGALCALFSILTHFYFNDKSIKIIRKSAPGLGIIVSTKEGLEKFLKFLVSEFSVENLEFFTLSMRWRHRLVLRDERRERRRHKLQLQTSDTIAESEEDVNIVKKIGSLQEIMDSLSSPFSSSDDRPIPNNMTLLNLQKANLSNDAKTKLRALPFPLLTFEFLDRDVQKMRRKFKNTITETSYCAEFSKTKTIVPQNSTVMNRKNRTQSIATKTMISLYFDQYDAMEHNLYQSAKTLPGLHDNASSGNIKRISSHNLRLKPTPKHGPIAAGSDDDDEDDEEEEAEEEAEAEAISEYIEELTYDVSGTVLKTKISANITPFVGAKNRSSVDEIAEFELAETNFSQELKEENEFELNEEEEEEENNDDVIVKLDSDNFFNESIKHTMAEDENTCNLSIKHAAKQRNDITFGGWFDEDSFDVYDDEWTQEFMTQKRVDYDRFVTLSEDINISSDARLNLRTFFKHYDSVKMFQNVAIAQYDVAFEVAWKDIWQNLNDSLRRFHHSIFYKEWLQSDAADGLNVFGK